MEMQHPGSIASATTEVVVRRRSVCAASASRVSNHGSAARTAPYRVWLLSSRSETGRRPACIATARDVTGATVPLPTALRARSKEQLEVKCRTTQRAELARRPMKACAKSQNRRFRQRLIEHRLRGPYSPCGRGRPASYECRARRSPRSGGVTTPEEQLGKPRTEQIPTRIDLTLRTLAAATPEARLPRAAGQAHPRDSAPPATSDAVARSGSKLSPLNLLDDPPAGAIVTQLPRCHRALWSTKTRLGRTMR